MPCAELTASATLSTISDNKVDAGDDVSCCVRLSLLFIVLSLTCTHLTHMSQQGTLCVRVARRSGAASGIVGELTLSVPLGATALARYASFVDVAACLVAFGLAT